MCPQNIQLHARLPNLYFWKVHVSQPRSVSELTLRLEVGTQTPRDPLGCSTLSYDRGSETQGAEGRVMPTLPWGDAAF